jgi:hypothetical protein
MVSTQGSKHIIQVIFDDRVHVHVLCDHQVWHLNFLKDLFQNYNLIEFIIEVRFI